MNTTEVFVEQVLIGGLVLAVFALASPEWTYSVIAADGGPGRILAVGGVVIGVAYLIGIIADRVIDTMLQELERWNRLRYAMEHGRKRYPGKDPFPEGRLRTLVMAQDSLASYATYLRTRVRLARAVAVMAPAISTAVLIGAIRDLHSRTLPGLALVGIYGLVLLARGWRRPKSPSKPGAGSEDVSKAIVHIWFEGVPRTDAGHNALEPYRNVDAPRWDWVLLIGFAAVIVLQVGLVRGFALDPRFHAVYASGAAVSVLALWSWSRISGTFYQHVDDAYWHVLRGEPRGR